MYFASIPLLDHNRRRKYQVFAKRGVFQRSHNVTPAREVTHGGKFNTMAF